MNSVIQKAPDGWKVASILSNVLVGIMMALSIWTMKQVIDTKERLIRIEANRLTQTDNMTIQIAIRELAGEVKDHSARLDRAENIIDHMRRRTD